MPPAFLAAGLDSITLKPFRNVVSDHVNQPKGRLSPDLNRIPQPLLLHLQPTLRQVRKDRETAGFDFQKSKNAPLQRLKLQFNAWNEVFQQHDAEMDF